MFYAVFRFNAHGSFHSTQGTQAIDAVREEAGCNVPLDRIQIPIASVPDCNFRIEEDSARMCGNVFKDKFVCDVQVVYIADAGHYVGINTIQKRLNERNLLHDVIDIKRHSETGEVKTATLTTKVDYNKLFTLWVEAGCPERLELHPI